MSAIEIMFWVTVLAYGAAALLSVLCALFSNSRTVWWVLTSVIIFLMINKYQNLLGLLTAWGRRSAWSGNWYLQRGLIQLLIIASIILLIGLLLAMALWYLHPKPLLVWLALTSFGFLLGFYAARAVSLHMIDVLLYKPIGGVHLNWVIEFGLISLYSSAAILTLWHVRQMRRSLTTFNQPLPEEPLST